MGMEGTETPRRIRKGNGWWYTWWYTQNGSAHLTISPLKHLRWLQRRSLVPPRRRRWAQPTLKVQVVLAISNFDIISISACLSCYVGLSGLARPTRTPVAGLHARRLSLGGLALTLKSPIAQFFFKLSKISWQFKPRKWSKNWEEPRLELKTDIYNVRKSHHCAIFKFIYNCWN
jgi:hypothetical protein